MVVVVLWFGVASLAGKTRLVVINGTLNAQRYRDEILDPVAIPHVQNMGVGNIPLDDNARPHTARIVQEHLQHRAYSECNGHHAILNAIEHLWDLLLLGRAVRNRVNNTTAVQDLRQIVADEWDTIPQQRVQRFISSMRRRCQAVTGGLGAPHTTNVAKVLNKS